MNAVSGYKAVNRLAHERPELLPVVRVCLDMAKTTDNDFAGKWVLKKFVDTDLKLSNLRSISSFGIIVKVGSARGGTRAYYSMPDLEGVEKALKALNYDRPE